VASQIGTLPGSFTYDGPLPDLFTYDDALASAVVTTT
jgi:hypothetical protein